MFPTLLSISLFERNSVASYTIEQRALGTSVFKNFWFFGFSCSRRTKKVPQHFCLSRCLKEIAWQAIQLNSGRQERPFLKNFWFFWIQLLETHKKCSQHFCLSCCLKEIAWQAIQLNSGRQERSVFKNFSFFVHLEQLNPKNQKFFKTDVPSARYSIVQIATLFLSNNEIDKSVGNIFCASRAAESKKPKILKTDVPSARYSIVQLATLFLSNNEIDKSVGNIFCASRAAESKKPKIFQNGRSQRPLFNCRNVRF